MPRVKRALDLPQKKVLVDKMPDFYSLNRGRARTSNASLASGGLMKVNRSWLLALFGAAVMGMAHAASAEDFPLKKWMQANMGANKDDAKALAVAFKKVAAFQPDPAWGEWKALSEKGAALASQGKLDGKDGASQVCKDCHTKFKDEYKAKYRTRALPPS
jgi:hypothetical protein